MLLTEVLAAGGLPEGVLSLITGSGRMLSAALTGDPRLAALTFTGSGLVGTRLRQSIADRNVKVQLELGGKKPGDRPRRRRPERRRRAGDAWCDAVDRTAVHGDEPGEWVSVVLAGDARRGTRRHMSNLSYRYGIIAISCESRVGPYFPPTSRSRPTR